MSTFFPLLSLLHTHTYIHHVSHSYIFSVTVLCKLRRCYNAAKNWQLDWYTDDAGSKKLLNPTGGSASFSPTTLTMVGIAEYAQRTDTENQPVTVKLETGTTEDYFIGFNRATGANAQNDEADNEVTITTSGNNGVGYSQSFLKAHLIKGESYTITNFAGSGQNLVITADDINIGTVPGVATICVAYEGQSCVPVDPTNQPTPPVSYISNDMNLFGRFIFLVSYTYMLTYHLFFCSYYAQPTPAPVPTNPPTTAAPTTAKPTASPTPAPTPAPTNEVRRYLFYTFNRHNFCFMLLTHMIDFLLITQPPPCTAYGDKNSCQSAGCRWRKSCKAF